MYSTPLNPGTPLLVDAATDNHFGAGLTMLPDSSLLVYMVTPDHPLGLEPGDIILGYEGQPWKKIVRELLDAEIPSILDLGGCESASVYKMLICAGMNWHLFDTIDVLKYKTGQTLHLSTDTLLNLNDTLFANGSQLPIEGVPMPGWIPGWVTGVQDPTSPGVTYGVVDGTNIGYIYVYHHQNDNVNSLFLSAVTALAQTQGLIIDLRFNQGGRSLLTDGIARLGSYAGSTLQILVRTSPTDLFSVTPKETSLLNFTIPQDNLRYQHPIAVLLGPNCVSMGDVTATQLTYLENVRFFGKSPTAGYSGFVFDVPSMQGFDLWCPDVTIADIHFQDTQLWDEEFPVDEPVWLSPDDVAKGEDDVVKSALEWINNLVYGCTLTKNSSYCRPGIDTLKITALIENPNSHQTSSKVYINSLEGNFIDSLELSKEGLSDSSEIWSGNYLAPDSEDIFSISLSAKDITDSKTWTTNNISRFTTAGPLVLDSISIKTSARFPNIYEVIPFLKNESKSATIKNASVKLTSNDSWAKGIFTFYNLPDINPGSTVKPSLNYQVGYIDSLFPGYFNFKVEIRSDGWTYWTDSMQVPIPAVGIDEQANKPLTFKLEQNYPNPFNPTTNIKYSIASRQFVELKVFNVLGQEIETLVNTEKPAGNYKVEFNSANLPSGVYFYKIQAGSFNQVRKMLLIK